MDGIDAGSPREGLSHLLNAVLASIKHDDFNMRVHSREHFLVVRHGGIDEGNLHALFCRHIIRQPLYDILTSTLLPTGRFMRSIVGHRRLRLLLRHLF